jgi:hypothetical protein
MAWPLTGAGNAQGSQLMKKMLHSLSLLQRGEQYYTIAALEVPAIDLGTYAGACTSSNID